MPTFKSLKDLEKFANKKIRKTVASKPIQNIFKSAMFDAVYEEVYEYYEPSHYERRYEDGGLSDARNMSFTSHEKIGNTLSSDFENLTVGNSEGVYYRKEDSMSGYFISHMIEHGSDVAHIQPANVEDGWYNPDGRWADPRPFAKATAQKLNSTTHNARLKSALDNGINN